jgi:hypothetical protein
VPCGKVFHGFPANRLLSLLGGGADRALTRRRPTGNRRPSWTFSSGPKFDLMSCTDRSRFARERSAPSSTWRSALHHREQHRGSGRGSAISSRPGAGQLRLHSAIAFRPASVICIQSTGLSRPPTLVRLRSSVANPSITSPDNCFIVKPSVNSTASAQPSAARASASRDRVSTSPLHFGQGPRRTPVLCAKRRSLSRAPEGLSYPCS